MNLQKITSTDYSNLLNGAGYMPFFSVYFEILSVSQAK